MTLRSFVVVVLAAMASLAACGPRLHLSKDHGQATADWLREQRISAKPEVGSPLGLDSEEASVVHKSYRKGMGGVEEARDAPSRVLLLQENKDAQPK